MTYFIYSYFKTITQNSSR